VIIALCLIFCCLYCKDRAQKVISALKKRKTKPVDGDLDEFVSTQTTPMEEQDNELVINPIILHEIQLRKERQMMKKDSPSPGKAAKADTKGRSGGLARLNLQVEERKVDPKKAQMAALDAYLEKEQGVMDPAKYDVDVPMTSKVVKGQQKVMKKGAEFGMGSDDIVTRRREARKAAMPYSNLEEDEGEEDEEDEAVLPPPGSKPGTRRTSQSSKPGSGSKRKSQDYSTAL